MNKDKAQADLIRRYTDQPCTLPPEIRNRVEDDWGGSPVQLYAMVDLDESLRLATTWVALGPDQIAVIRCNNKSNSVDSIKTIALTDIKGIREIPGLSCTQLLLLGEPGDPALASLRYTHRQRHAMENIKYLVNQHINGFSSNYENGESIYTDCLTKPIIDAQASINANKLRVILRLLGYMAPYKVRVTLGTLSAILVSLISLAPIYLTGYLIDDVFMPVEEGITTAEQVLFAACLVLAGIGITFVLRQFLSWVRMRTMAILGEYIARDLRTQVYEHLQKLSLSFYSSKQTGSIIARVSSDTDRLWDFIAWGAVDFLLAVVMLLGLGSVLLIEDWRLGLVMVLPTPFLFWITYQHGRSMHRIFLRSWRRWSDLTAILADTIPGVRVVKAFNQEDREKKRFDTQNNFVTDGFNHIHQTWTTFWPLLWLAVHMMMLAVWILAVPRVLGYGLTGPPLTVGVFVKFVMYMGMFVGPIETLGRMTFVINRATSSAHRVFEVLDTEPVITDVNEPIRLEPLLGQVTFENVSFAYDGVRQVICNMSFQVASGEMIGLVGPSGAGKSTVTNLIARFYEADSGQITIDGVPIDQLDLGHYRKQLGIVLQDPHLFHGSILDNIRYGVPEATAAQVIAAGRAANAHDFICRLPAAYDTIVGERGHTLSGGERQRISIARAVLCNPRILILDEATSSVDTETEHKIQEALERLVKGRTVFAIAHRLSTLRRANRLFVIEEGRITECGTHKELLENQEGTYTKLVNMQQELHEAFVA